VTYAINLTTSQ